MRVIAGSAGGRTLKGPVSTGTRPTTDKTKGAIFSMLEALLRTMRVETSDIEQLEDDDLWTGVRVLDLYAGTGGLGIEALSRGAAWADLVEQHRATCRVIDENLRLTGFTAQARVHCCSVAAFLGSSQHRHGYGIILLDPPYADAGVAETLQTLVDGTFATAATLIMAEHAHRSPLPETIVCRTGTLVALRVRRHGDTTISIYRLASTDDAATSTTETL